ncbi:MULTISPECIES: SEFIR domain-containing protein [Protofrankia]|uniref:SEFIR domain-containing protein n=1 Tax=Protofrankia coriariae TaxID=1562887 RepID=A0ABR5F7Y8_9ACTN|nr:MULTISPECIES: SEFIR domain-containing protein [Protofrankia]KLL12824.1 hypothetical protein FrCorBMG51_01375 [Protofrankia coriariae]ONH36329.1 hypothetical protein BL254_07620 [Protofrankia sp. BMG5.30]
MTDRPPRVFLSYAHESPEYENVVRDLWIFLRAREIDAKLDLSANERRQDWPLWMLAEVRESDHVLVMASPEYRRRSEGEAAADDGRAVLSGTSLGERVTALPPGLGTVWASLPGSPAEADARLSQAGHRLREALLDADAARRLTELIDTSPFGTAVDVVVEADGPALALPYELLRLADGRLLATMPGVRFTRRAAGLRRAATGPLKILVAVAAPEETRTNNPPLDVEAEMQAIIDAVRGVAGSRGPGPRRSRSSRSLD